MLVLSKLCLLPISAPIRPPCRQPGAINPAYRDGHPSSPARGSMPQNPPEAIATAPLA